MTGHADNTTAAHGQNRQRQAVIAAVYLKAGSGGSHDFRHLVQTAASFFHGDDIRNFGQSGNGWRQNVRSRPPRHIVHDKRQPGLFGNHFKMLIKTFLRRFIVIRPDQHCAMNAEFFRFLRQVDGSQRIIGTGAGNHCRLVAHRFKNRVEQFQLLVGAKRCRLTGAAGNH